MLFALLSMSMASAGERTFEEYQPIVERQMFGKAPNGFDPSKRPSGSHSADAAEAKAMQEEQNKLLKAVDFTVINIEENDLVMVGFTDRTDPKTPRHYYMAEGEVRGDWTVKAADPVNRTMTLVYKDFELNLDMANSGAAAKAGEKGERAITLPASAVKAEPGNGYMINLSSALAEKGSRPGRGLLGDVPPSQMGAKFRRHKRAEEEAAREEARTEQLRQEHEARKEEFERMREELREGYTAAIQDIRERAQKQPEGQPPPQSPAQGGGAAVFKGESDWGNSHEYLQKVTDVPS